MLSQNTVATSQNQAGKIQKWVSDFLTSVHPRGFFQKYPCAVGKEAVHKSHHHTMPMCRWWLGTECSHVFWSVHVCRGWLLDYPGHRHSIPQPQTNPTHPCMAFNPCIPAHITENHLNPRASKDPKSLVSIWYSKSAQKHAVRKVNLEIWRYWIHIIPSAQGPGPEGASRVFCIPTMVPVTRTHVSL